MMSRWVLKPVQYRLQHRVATYGSGTGSIYRAAGLQQLVVRTDQLVHIQKLIHCGQWTSFQVIYRGLVLQEHAVHPRVMMIPKEVTFLMPQLLK